jgi:hypothetical protein
MLFEGKKYRFTIQRIIEMPPDGEVHFVLENEEGLKFLLLEKYYAHYGLQAGDTIICKVDKVNCTGRIYLEPDHPFCNPGDVVDFQRLACIDLVNSFGEKEMLLILKDPWGQDATLNITLHPELAKPDRIECRVERIKKGQLLISNDNIPYYGKGEDPDTTEAFRIVNILTLAENVEYYRLEQQGSFFYLRTKYFSKYGFVKGQNIRCRLMAEKMLYGHYIEPEHPNYEIGRDYWFDFIRKEQSGEISDRPHQRLVVRDTLGHEYRLVTTEDIPTWIKSVKARVAEIKMSKCSLEFLEVE